MNNINITLNLLIEIKNAYQAKIKSIKIKNNTKTCKILNILYEEGYIRGYKLINKNEIEVLLKYSKDGNSLKNIELVSKPGNRVYFSLKQLIISRYTYKNISLIVSTPLGYMGLNKAILLKVGGEVICKIY